MGIVASKKRKARVLMIGLDSAGKTTILYRLKLGGDVQTVPTIGLNLEKLAQGKISLMLYDVGGQNNVRPLWRHYLPHPDAFIYVLDSSDRERVEEAASELHKILAKERSSKVLVFANKQDLPNALSPAQVGEQLTLNTLPNCIWHIQPTCATTGSGLSEGIDWLACALTEKKRASKA